MAYPQPDLKPGSKFYSPAVQTCEQGMGRWIQIPAAQPSWGELPSPAPLLNLLPAQVPDAKEKK